MGKITKIVDRYGDEISCGEQILIEREIDGDKKQIKHIVLLEGMDDVMVAVPNDRRFEDFTDSIPLHDVNAEKIRRMEQ